jgi:hypothetical protein
MRRRLVYIFPLILASVATGPACAAGIAASYSGRFQCREWKAIELTITDQGGGRISAVSTIPFESGGGVASYAMTGHYDERAGTFQLTPQRWLGKRPADGSGMLYLQGRFDPVRRRLTGKIDSLFCGLFELAAAGAAPLSQLPPGAPVAAGQSGNPALHSAPVQWGAEYWDATLSEEKAAVRESEPIDDVIDWLRREKYSCLGSRRVSWDASGTKGSAGDRVDTRARYVIECSGDCRGLRYMPATQAQVYGFGRSKPVPVLEMKGLWFGGTQINWQFQRPAGGAPPDVYIHQWSATGFDYGPGCKAPKSK